MGIWVLSSFRQLWLKLLLMFTYKSLCGTSFLCNKYLGGKLLTHKVSLCNFRRNSQTIFQRSYNTLYSLSAIYEDFSFSTSSPILFIYFIPHSAGYEVASHGGFNLHFPCDYLGWTYFHVLICHLLYTLVKCLSRSFNYLKFLFTHFFKTVKLNFKRSSYILDTNSLSNMFCKYFLQSVACFFIFLLMSFFRFYLFINFFLV